MRLVPFILLLERVGKDDMTDASGNPVLNSLVDVEMERKLNISLVELELNVPVLNGEDELLGVRNLDTKTLEEVKIQLQARGLALGMKAAAGKR